MLSARSVRSVLVQDSCVAHDAHTSEAEGQTGDLHDPTSALPPLWGVGHSFEGMTHKSHKTS